MEVPKISQVNNMQEFHTALLRINHPLRRLKVRNLSILVLEEKFYSLDES
jgi:hypothetical protein